MGIVVLEQLIVLVWGRLVLSVWGQVPQDKNGRSDRGSKNWKPWLRGAWRKEFLRASWLGSSTWMRSWSRRSRRVAARSSTAPMT